jgi:hypothetical protein
MTLAFIEVKAIGLEFYTDTANLQKKTPPSLEHKLLERTDEKMSDDCIFLFKFDLHMNFRRCLCARTIIQPIE